MFTTAYPKKASVKANGPRKAGKGDQIETVVFFYIKKSSVAVFCNSSGLKHLGRGGTRKDALPSEIRMRKFKQNSITRGLKQRAVNFHENLCNEGGCRPPIWFSPAKGWAKHQEGGGRRDKVSHLRTPSLIFKFFENWGRISSLFSFLIKNILLGGAENGQECQKNLVSSNSSPRRKMP